MAKAVATCICDTCGNEFEFTKICYNRRDADSFEMWAKNHITECNTCRRARLERERQETAEKHRAENAENTERAKKIGLPALKGTDKQVAWANTIRLTWISDVDKNIVETEAVTEKHRGVPEYAEKVAEMDKDIVAAKATLAWAKKHLVSASYWIENRNTSETIFMYAFENAKIENELDEMDAEYGE